MGDPIGLGRSPTACKDRLPSEEASVEEEGGEGEVPLVPLLLLLLLPGNVANVGNPGDSREGSVPALARDRNPTGSCCEEEDTDEDDK